MTASLISETIDALSAAVASTGIRVADHPIDSPSPPQCIISLDNVDYIAGGMMSAGVVHRWNLTVVVGRANSRGGWDDVAEYLDTSGAPSIRATLLADPTLGGVVTSLGVGSTLDIGTVAWGADSSFIIATLEVETHAK